jgi:hypothetical protein
VGGIAASFLEQRFATDSELKVAPGEGSNSFKIQGPTPRMIDAIRRGRPTIAGTWN